MAAVPARPSGPLAGVTFARRLFVAAQAACAALVLARLGRGRRRHRPLDARVPAPAGPVSVVIPARDEAARLGPCLEGLARDPDVAEVLVVVDEDDASPTATVAEALGAAVVRAPPLPPGWVGKAWALQRGLEAAGGTWVVCLDADTRPRPGLARALVAALAGADLVTAGGRFVSETVGERLLQPSMLATLVVRFGPADADGSPPWPDRVIANGQCLAARRAALLGAGGLVPTRGYMTDDVALARSLAHRGWRIRFRDGGNLLSVRMYRSGGEVWREWGRSLALADVTTRGWLALDLAVVWLAMALPLPRLLLRRATAPDVLLLAVRLALLPALARSFERRGVAWWLSPLADVVTAARLTLAVIRPTRRWRGRAYPDAVRVGAGVRSAVR